MSAEQQGEYTPTTEEVNELARVLMREWERAERAPVNVSYVATFADMARAALRHRAAHDADVAAKAKAEALREFADRFHPGDSNPWTLHVRARARRDADRIARGGAR